MKFLKCNIPYLCSLILVLLFPEIGSRSIKYLYGEQKIIDNAEEVSLAWLEISYFFYYLLGFISVIIIFRLYKYLKFGIYERSYTSLILIIMIPLCAYSWHISNLFNKNNMSVGIYLSIFRNDMVHLERILRFGGDPNRVPTSADSIRRKANTPLMIAAGLGNLDAIDILIKNNAHINAKNNDGDTASQVARNRMKLEAADKLNSFKSN